MTFAEHWATAIRTLDALRRPCQRAVPDDEPTLLVQRIAGNPVLCGGLIEHFSKNMPVWFSKTPEEDSLRPIDVLYGHYDPTTRSIEVFVNRIHQDARSFAAESAELLEIVRIHEWAHAVVHLGSRADDVQNHLSTFDGANKTAWSPFVDERTVWFVGFPTELHEFLAQALTFAALSQLSTPRRSERLREVFDALEAKQPAHYKLSPSAKRYAGGAVWPVVLDAARGVINVSQEEGFTLGAGLEALVCSVAEPRAPGDAPQAARP